MRNEFAGPVQGTRRKLRGWRKHLLLLAIFSLVGLVLGEVALQALYRLNWSSPLPYGMRGDNWEETLYVGFRPGFSGVSRAGISYTTNELGFRDDPVITSMEDHVIFLGDSTTFGLNISHEDTFSERLEQDLEKVGYSIQSVNTASPGQGTVSELAVLDEYLDSPLLQPRCVVLGFCRNDFSNNIWFGHYLDERSRKSVPRVNATQSPAFVQRQGFQLRVWLYLKSALALLRGEFDDPIRRKRKTGQISKELYREHGYLNEFHEFKSRPGREVEWDWLSREELLQNRSFRVTVRALDAIVQLSRRRGLPFVFLYLPQSAEIFREDPPIYKQALKDVVHGYDNATFLDITETYREYLRKNGLSSLPAGFYSSPGDATHPGPLASELISQALSPIIAPTLTPLAQ